MTTTKAVPSVRALASELAAEVRLFATDSRGNSDARALKSCFQNVVIIEHGMKPEDLQADLWMMYRDAVENPQKVFDLQLVAARLDEIGRTAR